MEGQNITPMPEDNWNKWEKQHKRGSIIGGLFVVIFGALFLARELGATIPDWAISWKTIFIAIGLAIGIKSNFRRLTWLVFVGIGTAFIVCDLYPELNLRHIVWPLVIILVGMVMIFKPRRKWDPERWSKWHNHRHNKHYHGKHWEDWCDTKTVESGEDHISSTTVFGGVKKNVISKDFKGGEIVNVFGGSEYNLSQADFNGTITIEIVQFFGGTKLIVPSNWEIKSELTAVLGGIDDKRPIQTNVTNTENKVLILNGTTVFGGIEIRS
ncbi:MAG: hypothetical protein KBG47_06630 [Bacteroidia bacterium]|nr:hypothetical protein [Bacteroidia bacterium]